MIHLVQLTHLQNNFERGTTDTFKIKTVDVGELVRLVVRKCAQYTIQCTDTKSVVYSMISHSVPRTNETHSSFVNNCVLQQLAGD